MYTYAHIDECNFFLFIINQSVSKSSFKSYMLCTTYKPYLPFTTQLTLMLNVIDNGPSLNLASKAAVVWRKRRSRCRMFTCLLLNDDQSQPRRWQFMRTNLERWVVIEIWVVSYRRTVLYYVGISKSIFLFILALVEISKQFLIKDNPNTSRNTHYSLHLVSPHNCLPFHDRQRKLQSFNS